MADQAEEARIRERQSGWLASLVLRGQYSRALVTHVPADDAQEPKARLRRDDGSLSMRPDEKSGMGRKAWSVCQPKAQISMSSERSSLEYLR